MKTIYSVVIPVYNSTKSLEILYLKICAIFEEIEDASFEVIMINDGSPNKDTWPILVELHNKYENLSSIDLIKNYGKHSAVLCGFHLAKGNYVVTLDDDLQHDPKYILNLLQTKDHDITIGSFKRIDRKTYKTFGSKFKNYMDNKIFDKPIDIMNSPFKLIKIKIIKEILKLQTAKPFISGMLFSTTNDIVNVDIEIEGRQFGKSNYTFKKSYVQFKNLLYNYSTYPLKILSYLGIVSFATCVLYLSYIVINYFYYGRPSSGWASLIVITLLLNGTILFSLGIIGEYFQRLIQISEHKPPFIIRTLLNNKSDEKTK